MEGLLGKFQSDLGKVSDEIRQLQVQSQTMSTKLKNRRVAENKLGAFVEHMAVSEDLVSSVLDTEVSICLKLGCHMAKWEPGIAEVGYQLARVKAVLSSAPDLWVVLPF